MWLSTTGVGRAETWQCQAVQKPIRLARKLSAGCTGRTRFAGLQLRSQVNRHAESFGSMCSAVCKRDVLRFSALSMCLPGPWRDLCIRLQTCSSVRCIRLQTCGRSGLREGTTPCNAWRLLGIGAMWTVLRPNRRGTELYLAPRPLQV